MNAIKLTVGQQVLLTAIFKDANNVVIDSASPDFAPPPGVPQPAWTEDSKGTIASLRTPGGEDARSVKGAECLVVGVAPGTSHVSLTDGDSGKRQEIEVIVAPSGVATIEFIISAAEPTEAPVPAASEPPVSEPPIDLFVSDEPPDSALVSLESPPEPLEPLPTEEPGASR